MVSGDEVQDALPEQAAATETGFDVAGHILEGGGVPCA
jgi:hypothetical protein